MKKLLLSAFVICLAGTSIAQESPLWMRHCALSPDGTTIVFTYKGDIYTVPSTGGRATQITTNPAFDTEPVWSPDSKQITFASDRMGSLDVFVVSSEGGTPQRLTIQAVRNLLPTKTTNTFYSQPTLLPLPKMPDFLPVSSSKCTR